MFGPAVAAGKTGMAFQTEINLFYARVLDSVECVVFKNRSGK